MSRKAVFVIVLAEDDPDVIAGLVQRFCGAKALNAFASTYFLAASANAHEIAQAIKAVYAKHFIITKMSDAYVRLPSVAATWIDET